MTLTKYNTNTMKQYNNIYKDVAADLIDHIDAYAGVDVYGSDLANLLFEGYNVDGSVTYSAYLAKQWIAKNFDDLGEIVERMQEEWEYNAGADVFNNPEKFQTCVYLFVAEDICGQLDCVQEFWNDCETLTDERIKAIKKDLQKIAEV